MTSKQRSAKQRKSRTSAKTSDRRKAGLDASKAARHTAYENKRVLANAEMEDDGAAPECTDETRNSSPLSMAGGSTILFRLASWATNFSWRRPYHFRAST